MGAVFGVRYFNRPNWFPAGASHRRFRQHHRSRQHRPAAAAGGAAVDESGFHRHRRRAPQHSPAAPRTRAGRWRHGGRRLASESIRVFRLGRRGRGKAGWRRDKCRQGRGQGLEIHARLFLTARTGVEARLLIAKTVTALPLRTLALGTLATRAFALLSKAAVIARLSFLAFAVGIGATVKVSVLPFVSVLRVPAVRPGAHCHRH